MYLLFLDIIDTIGDFFDKGGVVLILIAFTLFVMWLLIIERFWYFHGGLENDIKRVIDIWEGRKERKSWAAKVIRLQLISEIHMRIERNMGMMKTIIALCPLLGLLGTVTGMIEVFGVLSVTGGADIRLMAGGVSRATIPTMAGMVAALSGIFAYFYIKQHSNIKVKLIGERLALEH